MVDKRNGRSKDDSDLPAGQGRYSDNGGKADFTRRQFQRSREFEDLHPEVYEDLHPEVCEDLHPKAEASLSVLYPWLRAGFLRREFQAQFSVIKSGTLRERYNISLSRMLQDREIYGRFSHKIPITESTTYTREQIRHHDVSYQDFLNMQEKLWGDAKGQEFDSIGQSDGPNLRRLTKQDLDQWLKETEQYVHSQPDSDKSEWFQSLSTFNTSFEALKQDMNLFLSPEEQGVFSRRLQRTYTRVELAFHRRSLLEYANDLAKINSTGASDNRLVQSLFNANNNLYNMLMDFGVLKREIVKKIKEGLDKRFKDTTDFFYQKLPKVLEEAKKSAEVMKSAEEEKDRQSGEARLEELEKLEKLVKDYDVSFKYYRENNGTYFDRKQTLEKMEDIEYKAIKIIYPSGCDTVARVMEPIVENADKIRYLLDKNGIAEHIYSSKAWQQKMGRETRRKLFTGGPLVFSSIQELRSIAGKLSKALEYCQEFDEVWPKVCGHIDSVKGILARHNLNDLLDEAVDEELRQQLGDPLREGVLDINRQAFNTLLRQFAKKVRKAMECCQKFDEVGTEVHSHVDSINTTLKKYKKYNLKDNILGPFNEAVDEELRQVLGEALRKRASGTNGQDFDILLSQFAKKVRKAMECCQEVDKVGTEVRGSVDFINTILKKYKRNDLLESFNEELGQVLGEALREGASGTNGQAFKTLDQFASKVRNARRCCQEVDKIGMEVRSYVDSINTILKKHNLNDLLESFNEELGQVLGKALQEGVQGTNGQDFDALRQFASEVQGAMECCQKFDKVGMKVRSYVDSINTILKKHKRNDLLESFNEELRQQLGKALREGARGTNGQDFDTFLRQFALEVRNARRCCQKFDEVGTEVRSHVDSINTILKKYKKYNLNENILELFNKEVDEELGQVLGDPLREGARGTNGQAFDALLRQFASKVRNAMECCQKFDEVGTRACDNIDKWKDILAKHKRNDLLESLDKESQQKLGEALNEAVDKALRQKRDDALQRGARGTNGQAFKTLDQFALKIQRVRRRCQKVDKVGTEVRSHVDSINMILAKRNLKDTFHEEVDEELRQKLGEALQEEGPSTNKQAFNALRQFASKIRKAHEDCHTINGIVIQLEKSSNEAEAHELQQEHNRALLEVIQGLKAVQASDKRPAFSVLAQKLDKEMQERHHSYPSKIADMQSLYDYLQPSQTDFRRSFDYLRITTSETDEYFKTRINKLPDLKRLSDQFDKQRKNAQKRSDGESIEDNRILMKALSDIEESMRELERRSELLIGTRFNKSQARARATNYWRDLYPDEELVEKYKEACKHFEETRAKIQAESGGARTEEGYLKLGETLSSIESLEGELLIGTRFNKSQARARATNYWRDLYPDEELVEKYEELVEKYKEACKHFEETRAKIQAESDDARTEGYLELGKTLSSIESLEDTIRDSSMVEVFLANPLEAISGNIHTFMRLSR